MIVDIKTVQRIIEIKTNTGALEIVSRPKIIEFGSQAVGLVGPKGDAGNALSPMNFSFGDSSPALIYTLLETSYITEVTLDIETPFNGSGAALSVGTSGASNLLLAASHNDPSQALQYETNPGVTLAAGTQLLLTITPGAGATQGSGKLVIGLLKV